MLKPHDKDPNYQSELKRFKEDPDSWGPAQQRKSRPAEAAQKAQATQRGEKR